MEDCPLAAAIFFPFIPGPLSGKSVTVLLDKGCSGEVGELQVPACCISSGLQETVRGNTSTAVKSNFKVKYLLYSI